MIALFPVAHEKAYYERQKATAESVEVTVRQLRRGEVVQRRK